MAVVIVVIGEGAGLVWTEYEFGADLHLDDFTQTTLKRAR